MRVAILYDFMDVVGGGERVALLLGARLGAPVFTTTLDPGLPARAGFPDADVRSIGAIPLRPPFRQIAASARFSRLRLRGFDRVVCVGNFALYAAPNHDSIWYCLSPTRVFFDRREAMLARLPPGARGAAALWAALHGRWERRTVARVRRVLTLSGTVRDRIRRYYGQEVRVLYPPVPTSRYRFEEFGDFWLSVNRLYPEKRIELQLEAFRRLPSERLKIVGGPPTDVARGPYVSSLRPPPNVEFLGEIPDAALADLFARCRGLVATAIEEDFGLTPVEAMASGKCVLATDEGGYRETVVPGETGLLLPPDPQAFADAITGLDESRLRSMRDACVARARMFDEAAFLERMRAEIGG